jgi:hypothetical protein
MTDQDERPPDDAGVLSSLPGTRPQRRSPKRAATPQGTSPASPDAPAAATPAPPDAAAADTPALDAVSADSPGPTDAVSADSPGPTDAVSAGTPRAKRPPRDRPTRPRRKTAPAATADRPPVAADDAAGPPSGEPPPPAQGFEATPATDSVNPPTGAELLSSVAHGAVELAELGLSVTRRLARSIVDRLPRL